MSNGQIGGNRGAGSAVEPPKFTGSYSLTPDRPDYPYLGYRDQLYRLGLRSSDLGLE